MSFLIPILCDAIHRYAPKKRDDIIGNLEKVEHVKQWMRHWLAKKVVRVVKEFFKAKKVAHQSF